MVGEFVPATLADAANAPFEGDGFGLGGGRERRGLELLAIALDRRHGRDAVILGFVSEIAPAVAALVAIVGLVVFHQARVGAEIDDVLAEAGKIARGERARKRAAKIRRGNGPDEKRVFLVHARMAVP